MKRFLILYITVFVLAVSGISMTVAQTNPLPDNRQEITAKAYTSRYNKIDEQNKQAKLTLLNTRIIATEAKTNQQRALTLLDYIQSLIDASLDKLDDQNSREDNKSTDKHLPSQTLPNYQTLIEQYEEGTRVYQAGDKGALISRYEFIAKNEAFWIDELALSATQSLDTLVSSITLFDEHGIVLGSGVPSGGDLKIRPTEYLLQQGQTDFYIIADLYPMGYNHPADETSQFTLRVNIEEARGNYSDEDISSGAQSGDLVIVTPVKIIDYGFVDSAFGYTVKEFISENADETFALLTMTAGESNNRQRTSPKDAEISLDQVTVTVSTNLDGLPKQEFLESLRFERIDAVRGAIDGNVIGDTVVFSPSAFTNSFARIDQGETAARRIRGVLPGVIGSDTFVQLSIQNLGDGGVTYSEVSSSKAVTVLDGGTDQITAMRVREL